ncbi:MAG: carboxypeptidase regulatory-like domain-containing protein, partial [Terriglobales bacterium]
MESAFRCLLKSAALIVVLLAATVFVGQSTNATLQGRVTDSTGAVVPNAQVKAINTETNLTRTTQTDAAGNYQIPALPHGKYNVEVQAPGMGKQVINGLTLDVGSTVAENFSLKLAAVTETVDITGEAPVVESSTITVGQVVDTAKVQELPLNGRHMLDLAAVVPGTVIPPATGFLTAPIRGQGSLGVNTAGTREGTTNFMVNGINLVDMGNGQITFQPSINTISEFKMDNSTPSAEYGRNGGGVINVATRSGTNAFHGEVFDFLRNNAFDARYFFNKAGQPMAPFKRNDFGAALGGPIWKNHTFFFVSYEGLRQRQQTPVSTTVLTDAQRQQALSSPSPVIQKLVPLIPSATNGGNLFQGSLNTPVTLDQWTGDVRHVFNEKDSLHGFYVIQKDLRHEPTSDGNDVPGAGDMRQARRQILTLDETHVVSNSMVNDFRAGIQRLRITFIPENNVDPTSLGINDGKSGPIGIPQFSITGTNLHFGGASNFPQGRADYTATISDSVSYLRGNHNFRFGGEVRRYNGNGFTNDDGSVGFANLAAFMAGTPNSFTINSSNRAARVFENALAFFAEDSYKVTRNFSVELGLRWEWNMSPTEAGNRNSVFDPTKDWLLQVGTNGRNNVYQQNNKLFQPRVGFIWDILGDGKTVLRGGYGIMYDQPNPISFVSNYPFNVGLSFVPTAAKPTTSFPTLLTDAAGSGFTINTV